MNKVKRFRRWLKAPFVRLMGHGKRLLLNAITPPLERPADPRQIPVIINNFNRIDCLKQLISWLESVGMTNIYILDNDSTYPPLLEYYKTCPHEVIYLNKNVGYMALWQTDVFDRFKNDFYVYTDPDVLPVAECPPDFIDFFIAVLSSRADVKKVGFSLKIDDLPAHNARKNELIEIESKYWQKQVAPGVYDAPIDTTFALYRPRAKGDHRAKALRTGPPYTARHLPWYFDPADLPEEEIFYQGVASDSNSFQSS